MDYKKLLDFKFILLFFFIIRLYGIWQPPIESTHNWRQTTVLMITRNYYENKTTFAYPRVSEYGGKIIAPEFPILSFTHVFISKIFGYQHWYGRLINLIVSSIGIYFFYLFLVRFTNKNLAYYSGIILTVSIWFMFSRKTMPDTFSSAIAFISIYYGFLFFYNKYKLSNLLFYTLFCVLALLSKIPAIFYFSIFIIPFLSKNIAFKRKGMFAFASIFPLSISYFWYIYWGNFLAETYGSWRNFGGPILAGLYENFYLFLPDTLERFYFSSFHSFVAFGLFIIGLFFLIKNKEKTYLLYLAILSFFFILYIGKSGWMFHHHNYYIIPFVPIMAFCVAYALQNIKWKKLSVLLILIITVESILNQQHDFKLKQKNAYQIELENIADKYIPKNDKVIINNSNPVELYLMHREGWAISSAEVYEENLNYLSSINAEYIFINKESNTQLSLPLIYENEHYLLYKFKN